MDSFEINKILGALFASLLIIIGINELVGHFTEVEEPEQPGYAVEVEGEEQEQVAQAPEPVEPEIQPMAVRLANADASQGERKFGACRACHTVEQGGAHRVGPNLWNVVGAPIGGAEGYNYSNALEDHGGAWTYENLDAWLENPNDFISGNKMTYAGLDDPEDRANMIAYLRDLSNDPEPLPAPPAEEAADEEEAPAEEGAAATEEETAGDETGEAMSDAAAEETGNGESQTETEDQGEE